MKRVARASAVAGGDRRAGGNVCSIAAMAPSPTRSIPPLPATAMETNILGDLMVGLTTLDAAARPIPGIADHWETSRDGLTWTFHLRDARWSDGSTVTAQDFISAWRRLLDPKTAARTA